MDLYERLRNELKNIVMVSQIDLEEISITSSALTEFEAIGLTERKDFPILKGKEKLVEARFRSSKGQAYTDRPVTLDASIKDILDLDLEDTGNRVIFIASLNAIMKELGLTDRTVHCRDEEPEICSHKLRDQLREREDLSKILLVGYQPAMLENLKDDFDLRVLDLDKRNIGQERYGILVEDGLKDKDHAIDWADLILVTGSSICNGSIVDYMDLDKEVYFYGTSIAGPAVLLNLKRICFCAK